MTTRAPMSSLRCLLLAGGLLAVPGVSLSASPAPSASASVEPHARVELLDAGSAPRQLLRYALVAGQQGWMAMELDLSASTAIDGVEIADTVIPTIAMNAVIDIDTVDADGTARYSFVFVDAGLVGDSALDPELLEALDAQLSQLIGLSGWALVDDRGQALDGDVTIPADLDPAVQASLSQMQDTLTEASAPLPEEPVGIGARWSVEQHLEDQGIAIVQTGTYTLEAIEDDIVQLSVSVTQTAEPGSVISVEGVEPGTTVILRQLTGTGDGTMSVDLADIIPTSQLTIASTTILDVDGQALETQTVAGFHIRPGAPSDDAGSFGEDGSSGERAVRARHILYSPNDDPGGAREVPLTDPAWATASAEAAAAATALRAITDPGARRDVFAARARVESDDTGSGAQGGDLGIFSRDVMVEPFADAVFDAVDPQPGDIIGPVRSDFGWHVIMYDGEGTESDPTDD